MSDIVDTARRWADPLASLHFGFLLRPWSRSVSRSLRKEPKWYLRDWSAVEDPGARAETFVKADPFERKGPVVVPARTLLSQIL